MVKNNARRLSDIISMNEYVEGLEDIIWDGSVIIDKGFYLEIYINPDGVIPNENGDITANGYSCFRYVNKDVTLDELLKMDDFSEGSLRKFTMTIIVIPNQDPLFTRKREMCIPLFLRTQTKNKKETVTVRFLFFVSVLKTGRKLERQPVDPLRCAGKFKDFDM